MVWSIHENKSPTADAVGNRPSGVTNKYSPAPSTHPFPVNSHQLSVGSYQNSDD
jgi:hypothetical protein